MSDLSKRIGSLSPEQARELRRRLSPVPRVEGDTRTPVPEHGEADMAFSLLFFSGNGETADRDKYRLLLEAAKFADGRGFSAVWVPERHFQAFGGLFPNPSVLGGAIAAVTKRIEIRAGSVVLPLHHPIRVAEEWSVVDNLSGGRVALSFATGYHPGDFVLAPENYSSRREAMFERIETVRKLWRGETAVFPGVDGSAVPVATLPRTIRRELPVWVTSSTNPATWKCAGKHGFNVLSGISGIGDRHITDLAQKIALYRAARLEHGHSPEQGVVTLMLHTYIGDTVERVKRLVRDPLAGYLRTFVAQDANLTTESTRLAAGLGEADRDSLISHVLDSLLRGSSLLGSEETCAAAARHFQKLGVNEVACFIDFGLDEQTVLDGLERLDRVRARFVHSTPARLGEAVSV
jgi:natural product biosynthesis luciferase-like monooxygenase protein